MMCQNPGIVQLELPGYNQIYNYKELLISPTVFLSIIKSRYNKKGLKLGVLSLEIRVTLDI